MVSKIFIHAGHGKTGTSYIQSCLASSVESLKAQGISYPILDRIRQAAIKGNVTSGNIYPRQGDFFEVIKNCVAPEKILLSSESLFRVLFEFTLEDIRRVYPEAEIDLLLFVRNPLSNAASSYQEFVKQGKTNRDFPSFLSVFNKPQQVHDFIKKCQDNNVAVTIRNFSRCKNSVLSECESWLGVTSDTIMKSHVDRVNRSLSRSEMAFQRELTNVLGGKEAGFLSRTLCQLLPDVKSDLPKASEADLQDFLFRMEESVHLVNGLVGFEIYDTELIDPYLEEDAADGLVFSEEQIRVIVRALAKRMSV